MCKLRISAHKLNIEVGRYIGDLCVNYVFQPINKYRSWAL
jgi:hypothetical protein